jgi:hypothetical protein
MVETKGGLVCDVACDFAQTHATSVNVLTAKTSVLGFCKRKRRLGMLDRVAGDAARDDIFNDIELLVLTDWEKVIHLPHTESYRRVDVSAKRDAAIVTGALGQVMYRTHLRRRPTHARFRLDRAAHETRT